MKEITEEFLVKSGFGKNGSVFSYLGKDYVIDVWYCSFAIESRHWHCTIYSNDTSYIIGNVIVQTKEQLIKLLEIFNIGI